jgi:hypothetical protein
MVALMAVEQGHFREGLSALVKEALVLVAEDLVLHHAALLEHGHHVLLVLCQKC